MVFVVELSVLPVLLMVQAQNWRLLQDQDDGGQFDACGNCSLHLHRDMGKISVKTPVSCWTHSLSTQLVTSGPSALHGFSLIRVLFVHICCNHREDLQCLTLPHCWMHQSRCTVDIVNLERSRRWCRQGHWTSCNLNFLTCAMGHCWWNGEPSVCHRSELSSHVVAECCFFTWFECNSHAG